MNDALGPCRPHHVDHASSLSEALAPIFQLPPETTTIGLAPVVVQATQATLLKKYTNI